MDKDKIINDILSLIEEIRGEDELIETKYYLTNGWYLEIERFPPDGKQREEIYFIPLTKMFIQMIGNTISGRGVMIQKTQFAGLLNLCSISQSIINTMMELRLCTNYEST